MVGFPFLAAALCFSRSHFRRSAHFFSWRFLGKTPMKGLVVAPDDECNLVGTAARKGEICDRLFVDVHLWLTNSRNLEVIIVQFKVDLRGWLRGGRDRMRLQPLERGRKLRPLWVGGEPEHVGPAGEVVEGGFGIVHGLPFEWGVGPGEWDSA